MLRLKGTKVFLNGYPIGFTDSPQMLVNELRKERRYGKISSEINLAYFPKIDNSKGEVYVNCDKGRVRRVVTILEKGVPRLTEEHLERIRSQEISWEDLIKHGIIEFLDGE